MKKIEILSGSNSPLIHKIRSGNKLIRAQKLHAFAITWVPFLFTLLAFYVSYKTGIDLIAIGLMVCMYFVTMLGMTVGFHRMLSHNAFKPNVAVRFGLAVLGSMAAQGSPSYWVANHRRHHQFSDRAGDPHSPHFNHQGELSGLSGFLHAHYSWMFNHELSNTLHYCKDLIRDPVVSKVGRHYYAIVLLGFLIPTLLGALLTGTALGAFNGLLWGGFVRLLLTYHATSCINSVTHLFGSRPFDTNENSRNTSWLAIATLGEAWHNNHHAFPSSAYFGLLKNQVDIGGECIRLLSFLGMANDVKFPTRDKVNERLLSTEKSLREQA